MYNIRVAEAEERDSRNFKKTEQTESAAFYINFAKKNLIFIKISRIDFNS